MVGIKGTMNYHHKINSKIFFLSKVDDDMSFTRLKHGFYHHGTRSSTPRARSHFHSAGSRPFHASFIAWSSCPHLRENYSSLGTNVIIPSQNHKYSSWHIFHYSQVNWCSSFTCQRSLMAWVTGYCHIGSQRGGVPTQVRAGRPGTEGSLRRAGPS